MTSRLWRHRLLHNPCRGNFANIFVEYRVLCAPKIDSKICCCFQKRRVIMRIVIGVGHERFGVHVEISGNKTQANLI